MGHNFEDLKGRICTDIEVQKGGGDNSDNIIFTMDTGEKYIMMHKPDCCETVEIIDICGEINDIIETPILMAEVSESDNKNSDSDPLSAHDESWTWTFYKLATVKGYVTIRWYGTSNGYYSESVSWDLLYEPRV